jgi:predicted phage terminase large subunit-like protein
VLSLPAIAIDDEEYRYANVFGEKSLARKAGEALHPERDSVETYQKIREAVGEYNFQSQYQQSPMSREGGLVKKSWLKFYETGRFPSSDLEWTIQSWDTACKIGDANDYSVCTTWKLIDRDYYLVDVFHERLTYPELKRRAVELFNKFRPFKVVIEDQASGTALIQEIASEGVYCAEAYKPAPGSDKLVRFAAHSIKFENGRVFLPNQRPGSMSTSARSLGSLDRNMTTRWIPRRRRSRVSNPMRSRWRFSKDWNISVTFTIPRNMAAQIGHDFSGIDAISLDSSPQKSGNGLPEKVAQS